MNDKIKELAQWYRSRAKLNTRKDGEAYYAFAGTGDEAQQKAEEERCRKLSFVCHGNGDMLPDDWRFAFIYSALSAIVDTDDIDDIELEADIYTSELTSWLNSRNSRMGYCDEAVAEGLISETSDMSDRLMAGQLLEKREVLTQVLDYLREEADAGEDGEDDPGPPIPLKASWEDS